MKDFTRMRVAEIEKYVRDGGNVNACDENGFTPLHGAVARGHAQTVRDLLAAGADPNSGHSVNDAGHTPLHLVGWGEAVEIIGAMVEAGADVNARERYGQTPLHEAVGTYRMGFSGQTLQTVAKALLDAGADPNIGDVDGFTPLHQAVMAAAPTLPEPGPD